MLGFLLSWACIDFVGVVATTELVYAAALLCPKDTVLCYSLPAPSFASIPESLVEVIQYIHST